MDLNDKTRKSLAVTGSIFKTEPNSTRTVKSTPIIINNSITRTEQQSLLNSVPTQPTSLHSASSPSIATKKVRAITYHRLPSVQRELDVKNSSIKMTEFPAIPPTPDLPQIPSELPAVPPVPTAEVLSTPSFPSPLPAIPRFPSKRALSVELPPPPPPPIRNLGNLKDLLNKSVLQSPSQLLETRFSIEINEGQRIMPWSAKYNLNQSQTIGIDNDEDTSDSEDLHAPTVGTSSCPIQNSDDIESRDSNHSKTLSTGNFFLESPHLRWKASGRSSAQCTRTTTALLGHRNEELSLRKEENEIFFDELLSEPEKTGNHALQNYTVQESPSSGSGGNPVNLSHSKEDISVTTPITPSTQQSDNPEQDINNIEGITFDELIDKLTDPKYSRYLSRIVLLTYRSFTTSSILMEGLIKKFMSSEHISQICILSTIQNWMQQYQLDFYQQRDKLLPIIENYKNLLSTTENYEIFIKVADKMPKKWKEPKIVVRPLLPPIIMPDRLVDFWTIDAEEIARQLTLIDEMLFREIPTWEFLDQSWAKSTRLEKAPHICKMIARFNQVSLWVRCEIVTEVNIKKRAEILSKWLDICEHLQKLNNFNALMQILAALNSLPIFRLKKTWNFLTKGKKATWAQLQTIFDTRVMRTLTQQAIHPLIPFLGMYLTDLTLIDENLNLTDSGKINFAKRVLTARTIIELQLYQQEWYQFNLVSDVQEWLISVTPISDEEAIEACSLYVEPKKGDEQPEPPAALKEYLAMKPSFIRDRQKQQKKINPPPKKPILKKAKSTFKASRNSPLRNAQNPFEILHFSKQEDVIYEEKILKINTAFNSHHENFTAILDQIIKLNNSDENCRVLKDTALNELKSLQEVILQTVTELRTDLQTFNSHVSLNDDM